MKYFLALCSLCFFLLLTSCGSSRDQLSKEGQKKVDTALEHAHSYIGTKYRSGGTTPKGFDCSGYVQYVFKKVNHNLPRSSKDQSKAGRKIDRKKLLPGDLVFFSGSKGGRKVGHVGIVTKVRKGGNFDFIHSSTKRGIIVSSISEEYYKKRYITARRVIH